jgi:hypothetical protein
MDATRFDLIAKRLGARATRRTLFAVLAGLGLSGMAGSIQETEAGKKRKKCKGGKKKCGRKCIPKGNCCKHPDCGDHGICTLGACGCETGYKECQGSCIPLGNCCAHTECPSGQQCCKGACTVVTGCCNDVDCQLGQLCDQGQCVTGQGNCPAGANSCLSGDIPCGNGCYCFQSMSGETRFRPAGATTCNECSADAHCAHLGPGSFCAKDAGPPGCLCQPGVGFCRRSCRVN